jgi:3-deoxy-7-phosphoheptulonate synthase
MPEENWSRSSWRSKSVDQMPQWDSTVCAGVFEELSKLPSLVFAGEIRILQSLMKNVASGKAFILQCGNCAEEFSDCHGPKIHHFLKIILQMAFVLSCVGGKRIIKIGRIAGQYAKPRSKDFETINGVMLPSYRGDMVNSVEPNAIARMPDPRRMVEGYFRSASTLNLIRAFMQGGYGEIRNARGWHTAFSKFFGDSVKYLNLVSRVTDFLRFSDVFREEGGHIFEDNVLFTSHEALLLDYEESMTRFDTTEGGWFDTSAHMLWVGERTRHPEHAHIEFLRGVENPVGVKIGPGYSFSDIRKLFFLLNPGNEIGKVLFITRFGCSKAAEELSPLLEMVMEEGLHVLWMCDPMHGNTYVNGSERKTRSYDDIVGELDVFFSVLKNKGVMPAGVHLELTGENVTECVGGPQSLTDTDLEENYLSGCDPRLNMLQALELAFHIGQHIAASSLDNNQ